MCHVSCFLYLLYMLCILINYCYRYLEPYERYEAGEPALFPSPDPAPRRLTFQTTPTIQTTPPIPHSNHNLLAAKFSHLTQVPGFANLLKQVEKSPELISQIASLPSLLQLPPNQLQLIQLLLQQMAAVHSGKGGSGGVVGATRGGGKKCDWLVRSLECGLPNEVDLSINCLLILSYESGRDWLQVEEVPHLLAVLLAHVGVFSSGVCLCVCVREREGEERVGGRASITENIF